VCRHYDTLHREQFDALSGKIRDEKVQQLKALEDTAYCAVFIRGIDGELNVSEELLNILPMKGTTTGHDIFHELQGCIDRSRLPWDTLVSVATDGAPAMSSEKVGVVGLLKEKESSFVCQVLL